MSSFTALLSQHRKAKQWTQARLASAAGLDDSLVYRLETGERNPTANSITKIVDALGLEDADADALWLAAGLIPPGLESDLMVQAVALLRAAKKRRLFDLFEKPTAA